MSSAPEPLRRSAPPGRGAPGETEPRELRLDLPAAHSAGRMASHLVREFASQGGVEGDELETLLLVASELLSNAVDHGGGGAAMDESDLDEPVRMTLAIDLWADRWQMRVGDQGGGSPEDLQRFLDPDELPDLDDERGRGFFLLKEMLDSISVRPSGDGKGLEIVAERRRDRR